MDHELNRAEDKKPYVAPSLTNISLRPEEAVLGACKISGATGPVGTSCTAVGIGCHNVGS